MINILFKFIGFLIMYFMSIAITFFLLEEVVANIGTSRWMIASEVILLLIIILIIFIVKFLLQKLSKKVD